MEEVRKDTKRKIKIGMKNQRHSRQAHAFDGVELTEISEESLEIPILPKKVVETDHPQREEWMPQERYDIGLRTKIMWTFDKLPENLTDYELKWTKLGQRWTNRQIPIIRNAKLTSSS